MELEAMQRLAQALGIPDAGKLNIDALIRSIQFEEGHVPCFSEAWSAPCRIDACPFAFACSSNRRSRTGARH